MKQSISGKVARISVNHVQGSVSFMLEGAPTRYLLDIPGAKYLDKDSAHAFDLTQPGDDVEISFYERSSKSKDGDVAEWKNLTLDIKGGYSDML